eukprot:TRINITY_DN1564_c0_g1_i1.p1 TRINITY_DN1564_c0_g1~~TRINITY_DN1564_c0_g1_i1.p1  ORF type:complete len:350 (+),score=144.24 TRINITY_DN1564_c0_g1_i1:93-1142(+)
MQRFWAIEVQPGKPVAVVPDAPLHITQVALDANATSGKRSALQLTVADKKTTLGACKLNGVEQFPLDLLLDEDSEVSFEVVGGDKLHIAGYYVLFDDDEDDLLMDDEDEEIPSDESDAENVEGMEEGDEDDEEEEPAKPVPAKAVAKQDAKAAQQKTKDTAKGAAKQDATAQNKQNNKRNTPDVQSPAPESNKKAKTDVDAKKPQETPKKQEAKKAEQTPKKQENGADGKKSPATSPAAMKKQLANGLVVEELVIGTGSQVVNGHKVGMKYIGKLTNGKVFDSALNAPFTFRLGVGEVIKGWDEGIKGMREGGKRRLVIPAGLAYGKQRAGDIPPNSTLIFEIECVRAF